MLERPHSRHAVQPGNDAAAIGGEGVIARIADIAFENPAMAGGLLVMAITATAIVSNAMFLQTSRHPDPLFMTRPAIATPAKAVPLPRVRADQTANASAADAAPATGAADGSLVSQLQRALAAKGYYTGAVDGKVGAHTRAAVSAFQKAAGLPVTGEVSRRVLDQMKNGAASTAPTPAIPIAAPAIAVRAPAVPAKVAVIAPPQPADPLRDRNRAVEAALNQIGYGPIPADGDVGSDTQNAIRRFELDNGLPITGQVDEVVVRRLVSIGAMKPI